MKEILGGKGANLADMSSIGIPVPPGFTVTTEVCDLYSKNKGKIPEDILKEIDEKLEELEKKQGKKLGGK